MRLAQAMETKDAILGRPEVEAGHAAAYREHADAHRGRQPMSGSGSVQQQYTTTTTGVGSTAGERPSKETEMQQRTLI